MFKQVTDELRRLQNTLTTSLDETRKNLDAGSELPGAFYVILKQHADSALNVGLKHCKDHIEVLDNFSDHALEYLDRQGHTLKSELNRMKECAA